ncbi:50S ribosomal protein L21 [Spirochaeta cellobiosiphila]|uniref:50S ribosomal protein L21 n=1 Tax=Spirochaeta cellobiosiphila TaxID=504483 RepID=UPI000409B534|nr:50S ribosomal protein L21 [Spirochaeta cellobiosiphila]
MYALVEIKGKQYKAEKGGLIKVDKFDAEPGKELVFDSVLLVGGDDTKVGNPFVAGVTVKAEVADHGKDKKVIVYKYKRRKGYKKKQGHRQQFSILKVLDIVGA